MIKPPSKMVKTMLYGVVYGYYRYWDVNVDIKNIKVATLYQPRLA